MPSLTVKIKTVSPLFLNGAEKTQPELRAASVRGQLRYWFRAIWGTRASNLEKLWERESSIFGSTELGSRVSIRVFSTAFNPVSTDILPHRSGGRGSASAIPRGFSFDLQLHTVPGVEIPKEVDLALQMWLLLGGLGKRSRRMFGALQAERFWDTPINNTGDLIVNIERTINRFARDRDKLSQIYPNNQLPHFPTLHPSHSRIVVGYRSFGSSEEANISLFKEALRIPEFQKNEDVFGYAKSRERRASPLIAQVRKLGNDYYPVLTIMRSSDIKNTDWGILNRFMDKCESVFDGQTVWGGETAK